MITKTFKLTVATDTEEQMQKEEEHLSMVYGAEQIEEDKPGKWITNEATISSLCYPIRKCSRCGYEYIMTVNFRYCPNCGAKMEEEKDASRSYELDNFRTCRKCKYAEKPANLEPCFSCIFTLIHTSWEPKEKETKDE